MKIETLFMLNEEVPLIVSALLNEDIYRSIATFANIGSYKDSDEIMNLINSIHDCYFPYEDCNERRTYAKLIERFICDDDYSEYYACFIKNCFCGLIKIERSINHFKI